MEGGGGRWSCRNEPSVLAPVPTHHHLLANLAVPGSGYAFKGVEFPRYPTASWLRLWKVNPQAKRHKCSQWWKKNTAQNLQQQQPHQRCAAWLWWNCLISPPASQQMLNEPNGISPPASLAAGLFWKLIFAFGSSCSNCGGTPRGGAAADVELALGFPSPLPAVLLCYWAWDGSYLGP